MLFENRCLSSYTIKIKFLVMQKFSTFDNLALDKCI